MHPRWIAVAAALATVPCAAPASAATVTFPARADTTVGASGLSRPFAPLLRIDGSPVRRALVRFDARLPAGATVTRVRLRLYAATRRARRGYRVRTLTGRRASTWRESIRGRRVPAAGRSLGRRRGWSKRGYKTSRLRRDAVSGSGPVSFAIVTTSRAGKAFQARESEHPPQLVVTYSAPPPRPVRAPPPVFSDEFNGGAGAPPNPAVWAMKTGGRWMNGGAPELQCYTRRPENVSQDGLGHLVITARYEPGNTYCADGPNDYTSARLDTRALRTFRYGRIDARIKLPTAPGSWPAWWMVGASGNWPAGGEIDILEYHAGPAPTAAHHAIHADSTSGAHWQQSANVSGAWSAGWHAYGIDWRRDRIAFRIDGVTTWTRTAGTVPPDARWRFNQPFGLLLNLAVGNWGGTPDPGRFPTAMLVDWVRVTR